MKGRASHHTPDFGTKLPDFDMQAPYSTSLLVRFLCFRPYYRFVEEGAGGHSDVKHGYMRQVGFVDEVGGHLGLEHELAGFALLDDSHMVDRIFWIPGHMYCRLGIPQNFRGDCATHFYQVSILRFQGVLVNLHTIFGTQASAGAGTNHNQYLSSFGAKHGLCLQTLEFEVLLWQWAIYNVTEADRELVDLLSSQILTCLRGLLAEVDRARS